MWLFRWVQILNENSEDPVVPCPCYKEIIIIRCIVDDCSFLDFQTILLQNMYQNPQSAAQVADGTSEFYLSCNCVNLSLTVCHISSVKLVIYSNKME